MEKIAPFADVPIVLSLGSITGIKYRTLSCVECGRPIIESSGDRIFRIGAHDMPELATTNIDGAIDCVCSRCKQKYAITISVNVSKSTGIPLYMQPQSIFMAIEPTKKLRDTYCMECGKAFYSVSDRIGMLTDNTIPFDMLDPQKLGPMEVWCKFNHCKQRWAVMT